jgi:nitrate reductase NapD
VTHEELHIAGLVVHARPQRIPALARGIAAISQAHVHATSPAGKLIVTLEAPSAAQITDCMAQIQRLEGVFAATLVYQYADSLEEMNAEWTVGAPREAPHAPA